MRQKERNIKAEVKAGVTKSYLPVGLSLAVQDSLQGVNANAQARLSLATVSNHMTSSVQPPMAVREDDTI